MSTVADKLRKRRYARRIRNLRYARSSTLTGKDWDNFLRKLEEGMKIPAYPTPTPKLANAKKLIQDYVKSSIGPKKITVKLMEVWMKLSEFIKRVKEADSEIEDPEIIFIQGYYSDISEYSTVEDIQPTDAYFDNKRGGIFVELKKTDNHFAIHYDE